MKSNYIIYIAIGLLIVFTFLYFHQLIKGEQLQEEKIKLKYELAERDSLISHYESVYQEADSTYKKRFKEIDSIQHKIYENDTSTYVFSTDSLTRLWTERFGNH